MSEFIIDSKERKNLLEDKLAEILSQDTYLSFRNNKYV